MENTNEFPAVEENIVKMLKTVYDPEIPVNIYDLGLIYKIDLQENGHLEIDMTLTSPNCPAVDFIVECTYESKQRRSVKSVNIKIVFDPIWDKSMMSEEAQLELGFL